MPKYKCKNGDCKLYDEVISMAKSRITIVNGTAIDGNDYCPECKQERELLREGGMTVNISGTNDQRLRMERQ